MSSNLILNWKTMSDGHDKRRAYMASREWALKREAVHVRSDGTCERCRNARGENVHHQTYQNLYREEMKDLLHLCRPCHEFLSAKREHDPRLDAPVSLNCGKVIRSVYLAGKITGDYWRDEIAPGWSEENHGLASQGTFGEYGDWKSEPNAVPVPDGRMLALTGPWWMLTGSCGGHSSAANCRGAHLMGDDAKAWLDDPCYIDPDEHSTVAEYEQAVEKWKAEKAKDVPIDEPTVTSLIYKSVISADLLFAWVDQHQCYGTIAEIGMAIDLHTRVCFACTPEMYREHWLVFQWVNRCSDSHLAIVANTPTEAWKKFWAHHGITDEPSS